MPNRMTHLEQDFEPPSGCEEWKSIHPDDLWVYNKLIIATKLGYHCGPTGVNVPQSGEYIVRPTMNLLGMGVGAERKFISSETDHLHPSLFWSEIFSGEHLSVDFHNQQPELIVKGLRDEQDPLWRWRMWYKVERLVFFPDILQNLSGNYEWINCEFIGGKLIEVHFRRNPDFRYGNSMAIPVWEGEEIKDMTYVEDGDFKRKGFYIK